MNCLVEAISRAKCKEGEMVFWWLGQLGYAIKISGLIIYIDGFFTDVPGRSIPPRIHGNEINNADIIMGTHDHLDHIDRAAWVDIAKASPQAVFIVPAGVVSTLEKELPVLSGRLIGVNDGQTVNCKGLEITGIAAAHEFLDFDPETGLYPYMGYSVSDGTVRFYHSGDTCIYEGMISKIRRNGHLNVAFLPINGRDAVRLRANCIGNMTYQEAVDLAGTLKPDLTVPGHYDMFKHNSEDPQKFEDYFNLKYPKLKCWIGKHYEEVTYRQ
ncbi:MAG: MBL fold metallo-hydrolase [Eubacteriales bacterium]